MDVGLSLTNPETGKAPNCQLIVKLLAPGGKQVPHALVRILDESLLKQANAAVEFTELSCNDLVQDLRWLAAVGKLLAEQVLLGINKVGGNLIAGNTGRGCSCNMQGKVLNQLMERIGSSGLLLAAAALSDSSGVVLLVVALVAAPFLRSGRWTTRGLRAANTLVLAFPALGTLATVILLNIAFFRVVWPDTGGQRWASIPERAEQLSIVYTEAPVTALLLASPVLVALLIAIMTRRPTVALVAVAAFALIQAGFVVGLVSVGAVGTTYLVVTLLAITLLPTGRSVIQNAVLTVVALGQLVVGWVIALDRELVVDWMLIVSEAMRVAVGL